LGRRGEDAGMERLKTFWRVESDAEVTGERGTESGWTRVGIDLKDATNGEQGSSWRIDVNASRKGKNELGN
jgi:hypothetical protein